MLCDTRNSSTGLPNRGRKEKKKVKKKVLLSPVTQCLNMKDLQRGRGALKNAPVARLQFKHY